MRKFFELCARQLWIASNPQVPDYQRQGSDLMIGDTRAIVNVANVDKCRRQLIGAGVANMAEVAAMPSATPPP